MSAVPMNGNGPAILPDGTTQIDPELVTNALLNAVQQCAVKAAGAQGQDAKDFMAAALSGAQAVVVLDPSLSQGGTPLQHDLALEAQRGQTQENVTRIQGAAQIEQERVRGDNQLRQAKETAAAPTPAKHITINRSNGRTTQARVSG